MGHYTFCQECGRRNQPSDITCERCGITLNLDNRNPRAPGQGLLGFPHGILKTPLSLGRSRSLERDPDDLDIRKRGGNGWLGPRPHPRATDPDDLDVRKKGSRGLAGTLKNPLSGHGLSRRQRSRFRDPDDLDIRGKVRTPPFSQPQPRAGWPDHQIQPRAHQGPPPMIPSGYGVSGFGMPGMGAMPGMSRQPIMTPGVIQGLGHIGGWICNTCGGRNIYFNIQCGACQRPMTGIEERF